MINATDISALLSLYGSSTASNTQNQDSDSGSFEDSLNSLIGLGGSDSTDSSSDISSLFGTSGMSTSSSDFLSLFGGQQASGSAASAAFSEPELNQGGPLPAFLTSIESQLGLTKDQDNSLEQIAVKFLDAPGEPNVSDVAAALTQAGLPA